MPDTDEKVVFLLPDGTEVSNDPRYYNEKMREQILATYDNPGVATPTMAQMHAELGTGDPLSVTTGAQVFPPSNLAPPDLRKQLSAQDDDVDPDSDDETPLEEMTGSELKARVRELRDSGVEVDTAGVTKKSGLVAAIKKAQG